MAATLNITINLTNPGALSSISELNIRNLNVGSRFNSLIDLITAIQSGQYDGTAIITSRDTDPGVTTSGAGSLQATLTF